MMRSTLMAAVAAVFLLSPPAARAAEDGTAPTPSPEQGSMPEAAPDDGELTHFVAAFVRLIGVQHGYMVLMQDEQDPGKLEEMKRDALTDMAAAVQRDGMSIDRYNQIALAVRDDPQLQGKVEGILQQMAADPEAQAAPGGE